MMQDLYKTWNLKKPFFLLSFIFVIFFSGLFITNFLDQRLKDIRDNLISLVESKVGRKISYQSFSPNYLQAIEIRGLKVFDQNGKYEILSIPTIKIDLNLLAVLTGKWDDLINDIIIENLSVRLNLDLDSELMNFVKDLWEMASKNPNAPWPNLSVHNAQIVLISKGQELQFKDFYLNLIDNKKEGQFLLHGSINANHINEPIPFSKFITNIIGSGRTNHLTLNTFIQLTINNFETPEFKFSDITIQGSLIENILTIKKVQDKKPIDLSYSLDLKKFNWDLSLKSQDFRLSDLITFRGNWTNYNQFAFSAFSGQINLSRNVEVDQWQYGLNGSFQIPLPAPFGISKIEGSLSGNQFIAELPSLSFHSSIGTFKYSGNIHIPTMNPTGILTISEVSLVKGLVLNGTSSVSSNGMTSKAISNNLNINGLQSNAFEISVTRNIQSAEFNVNAKFQDTSNDRFESKISIDGVMNWADKPFGNADIEIEKFPIKYVLPVIPVMDQIPSSAKKELDNYLFSIQSSVIINPFETNFTDLFFQVDHANNPLRGIEGNISKVKNNLQWKNVQLKWDYWITEMEGSVVFENLYKIHSSIKTGDISYYIDGDIDPEKGTGTLNGNYGILASWVNNPYKEMSIALKGTEIELPHILKGMSLTFQSEWKEQGGQWEVDIPQFQLTGKSLLYMDDFVFKFKSKLNNHSGIFEDVGYKDRLSELAGTFNYETTNNLTEEMRFSGAIKGVKGTEVYSVDGVYSSKALNAFISFIDFPLERMKNAPVRGNLSGSLGITNSNEGPRVEIKTSLLGKTLNNDPLNFNANIQYQNDKLNLFDSNLLIGSMKISGINGIWDFNTGNITTKSKFETQISEKPLYGNFDTVISLNKSITLNDFDNLILDRINGQIKFYNAKLGQNQLENVTIDFSKVKSLLTFRGGKNNFFQGRISDSGDFKFILRDPFPIVIDAEGKFSEKEIYAKITQLDFDMAILKDIVNSSILKIKAGRISGGLVISGNNNDPNFEGSLKVSEMEIETSFLTSPLKNLNTDLIFSGNSIKMDRATASVNQGKILASADLQLDHWGISYYSFRLDTIEGAPLPVSYQLTGLDAKGSVAGHLTLKGTDSSVTLGGDIVLEDIKIMLNQTPESNQDNTGNADLPLIVDLNIQTGRRVEFIWPNETLTIGRAYASPGQKLKIIVDGITGKYLIAGEFLIRGGEINYFNNTFYLKEGKMVFKEDNTRFDPKITLTAELRQYFEDKPLAIYLKVDDFLSKFSPRFESSPPKSPEDLLAILTQALAIPEEYTNVTSLNTAISIASDVGTSFLLKPAIDTVKKALNLDLFSLKTQFIKKAFIGNQSQEPFSVIDYLDNTSIFLGKYLGDSLFLEGLLNLSTKDKAETVSSDLNNLKMQFELGMELQTPWMLINWRFVPKSPDKLFIPDNTISFSWRFTY